MSKWELQCFSFFTFIILWLNDKKRFKHEKPLKHISLLKKHKKNTEKSFGGGGGSQFYTDFNFLLEVLEPNLPKKKHIKYLTFDK